MVFRSTNPQVGITLSIENLFALGIVLGERQHGASFKVDFGLNRGVFRVKRCFLRRAKVSEVLEIANFAADEREHTANGLFALPLIPQGYVDTAEIEKESRQRDIDHQERVAQRRCCYA